MSFYADLHIHSKYSRATSRDCDLENLAYWGLKKGISVIGTGDFTHPAWFKELQEKLVPAEPGLFRLRPDIEKSVTARLPSICSGTVRFMLSVEISTIYKKGDKVRKIHHLVYAPDFEKAQKIRQALEKIGNIRSDGRPILGLDSRHLLEIVLSAGTDCFIVPAHIWTPWFAVLGSKSGFDNVADCYGDLADHIFAVETGLSSDPEMNWKVSHLDRYRLMSNSDAHSPAKLGREVNSFNTEIDYFKMKRALETGKGFGGTLEFFPEEGKYHADGHRKCNVRLNPAESRAHNGLCPVCKKPLTLGVLYRVEELADRHGHQKPAGAADFHSVIPLPEMISEIMTCGTASQTVGRTYEGLISKLGPEISILNELPLKEIEKNSSSIVSEAVRRMRAGEVIRDAGYDGEYGVIRLFNDKELKERGTSALFEIETPKPVITNERPKRERKRNNSKNLSSPNGSVGDPASARFPPKTSGNDKVSLDDAQEEAAAMIEGSALVIAGPGSGKTRVLTHRIAALIRRGDAAPKECLTITFSRRAAAEIRERLRGLIPAQWQAVPVTTFHALCLEILAENREAAGLPRGFHVTGEIERIQLLAAGLKITDAKARKLLPRLSLIKRGVEANQGDAEIQRALEILAAARDSRGWMDYDDLLIEAVHLLQEDAGLQARYRGKFRFVSIDEYQDIDPLQYRLVRLIVHSNGNLFAIGDPDQAIYGFRGSDVAFFLRFREDFPQAREIRLTRNYRSGRSILSASNQLISPAALVSEREIEALLDDTGKVVIHEARSEKSEAEFVVQRIEDLMGGTSFFSMDSGRSEGTDKNFGFSDFAVLFRTEAQAEALEEALQRSGIPFQRRSHGALAGNPEVAALLKALENNPSATPLEMVQALRHGREADPLFCALEALAGRTGNDRAGFLSEIHLSRDIDTWDERADRVSLLTLHAAKGLEFGVVFITGCEDGLLPLSFGKETAAAGQAEERRLFYVGMTRAKEKLFLSHAARRMRSGRTVKQAISPFLRDIEEKLLERAQSGWRKKPDLPDPQLKLI